MFGQWMGDNRIDLDDDELKETREMNGSDKNVGSIEDIKLVENLIKEYKAYNDLDGIQDLSSYVEALEHLIKAYKELEEENKELKEKWDKDTHKLQNELDLTNADKINNYIPISLVEEKIEELKDGIKRDMINYDKTKEETWKIAIHHSMEQKIEIKKVLQELLERGTRKWEVYIK